MKIASGSKAAAAAECRPLDGTFDFIKSAITDCKAVFNERASTQPIGHKQDSPAPSNN